MPGVLCEHCTGLCCRYIALPIDTPEDRGDFDDIRWYLLHENVAVFVEDGQWYVSFAADCRHLLPDFRCAIYRSRPRICREYTTDNCDYHSGDYGWELYFTCPEHLDEYVRARQREGRGRRKRNSRPVGRGARRRPRARSRPRLTNGSGSTYAKMTTDRRGTPLPVLEVGR